MEINLILNEHGMRQNKTKQNNNFQHKKNFYFLFLLRVIPKIEGESAAMKFSCAFCETTAADDYEYVQQLFHRTVREVRKERERAVASNTLSDDPLTKPININTNANFSSLSSSLSSNSSTHFVTSNEVEKISSSNIPLPPPMPATLAHKANRNVKHDSQSLINQSNTNSSFSSSVKSGSLPPTGSSSTLSSTGANSTTPTTNKRTVSKTSSVLSKIFK